MIYPIYIEDFIKNTDELFEHCLGLPWIQAVEARKEYFMATARTQYDYGKGPNVRSYYSEAFTPQVSKVMEKLNWVRQSNHNMCFFNRYDTQFHALGYHSDDSPSMDIAHDIGVISLGAEREICWKKKAFKGELPDNQKQLLKSGSLFIMPPFMQLDWLHKISKSDRPCGTRISLTFRRHLNLPDAS